MSEEKIIKILKNTIRLFNNDTYCFIDNDRVEAIQGLLDLYQKEKDMHKNTGKLVRNKRDGKIGIVLREWETGQITVIEKIREEGGIVINTHDSWKTLEVIEDE